MPTKTYGQTCALARSLDVLGDRWTILVVRELLLGPKRFKHLLAALPGIGSNRLSDRLKGLEDNDVVVRVVLPAPASVAVYELTQRGQGLRDPLVSLALWGLDLPFDDRLVGGEVRAELIALAMTGTQTVSLDPARRDAIEFRVGDEVFHFLMSNGRVLPRSGPASEPTATVACDVDTFVELGLRTITPTRALRSGRATVVSGSRRSFTELYRVLVRHGSSLGTQGSAEGQELLVH